MRWNIYQSIIAIIIMENLKSIQIQIRQIKILLSEFRKTKIRCLGLYQKLDRDLPNLFQQEIIQANCKDKIETLDLPGVINLKKQLLENLSQISELERDMQYEARKSSFTKAIKIPLILSRQAVNEEELGPFEIPTYNSKIQSNENKIDRLAKFIMSLGKSMNILRKCILGEWEWDQNVFYKFEPEYLDVQRRVQRFQMRDQQLANIVEKIYEQQLEAILSKGTCQISTQSLDFQIIKIPKKVVQMIHKMQEGQLFQMEQQYHPVSMVEPKRKPISTKKPLQKISEQYNIEAQAVDLVKHTSDITLDLIKAQQNQIQIKLSNKYLINNEIYGKSEDDKHSYLHKGIDVNNQENSSLLPSSIFLKTMRKKVFQDDIWDQFDKI